MNKYLVDTSVILDLWDNKYKNKLKKETIKLQLEIENQNSELYVNPLIIAEVLQGINLNNNHKFDLLKNQIESMFQIVMIDKKEWELSIAVYRKCKSNGINFNKEFICARDSCGRKIFNSGDCVHYSTSRLYGLEIITGDSIFEDIDKVCKGLNFN